MFSPESAWWARKDPARPRPAPASIVRDLSPLLSLTPRKAAMDGGLPACGRANFRSPETSQEVSGGKSLGQRLSDGAT